MDGLKPAFNLIRGISRLKLRSACGFVLFLHRLNQALHTPYPEPGASTRLKRIGFAPCLLSQFLLTSCHPNGGDFPTGGLNVVIRSWKGNATRYALLWPCASTWRTGGLQRSMRECLRKLPAVEGCTSHLFKSKEVQLLDRFQR